MKKKPLPGTFVLMAEVYAQTKMNPGIIVKDSLLLSPNIAKQDNRKGRTSQNIKLRSMENSEQESKTGASVQDYCPLHHKGYSALFRGICPDQERNPQPVVHGTVLLSVELPGQGKGLLIMGIVHIVFVPNSCYFLVTNLSNRVYF